LSAPPVSVLLPFKNAISYLEEALASLAVQSMADFEVVAVDDGSTDGSGEAVSKWCGLDDRFRYLENPGRGLVDALNAGLLRCRGEWVARMDADDICHPDRLKKQLEAAGRRGERTVITCRVSSFPESSVTDGFRAYENWLNSLETPDEIERNLFVESPVPHPTAFFHRKSVISEGGYLERELPEDYELWLRLWSKGYTFERVPETLLRWREREDRYSRVSGTYSMEKFYRLKARYLRFVPCMSGRRIFVAGAGQAARRLGRCLMGEGFAVEAFLAPRGGRGDTLLGRPVLTPDVLTERGDVPIAVATRASGAGEEIRKLLLSLGLSEWSDFVMCS